MANTIITIARQYGSGGREIGALVAKELGISFYDHELITMAAEKSDLCREAAEKADEKNANSLLYTLAMGSSAMLHAPGYNLPVNDRLFLAQSEIIKEIAAKESAVIVGRCADYVLREHKPCLHVFIHTNIKARAERVAKRNDITESGRNGTGLCSQGLNWGWHTAAAQTTTTSTPARSGARSQTTI